MKKKTKKVSCISDEKKVLFLAWPRHFGGAIFATFNCNMICDFRDLMFVNFDMEFHSTEEMYTQYV